MQVHSFPTLQPPPTCLPPPHISVTSLTAMRCESPESSGQVLGVVEQAEGPCACLLSARPRSPARWVSRAPHQRQMATLSLSGTVLLSTSCPKRLQEAQEQPLCGGSDSIREQRLMGATVGGEPLQRAFRPAQHGTLSGLDAPEHCPKALGQTHRAGQVLPLLSLGTTSRKHLPTGPSADIPPVVPRGPASQASLPPRTALYTHPTHPTEISAAEPDAALTLIMSKYTLQAPQVNCQTNSCLTKRGLFPPTQCD